VLLLCRSTRQREPKHEQVRADINPIGEREAGSQLHENRQLHSGHAEQEEVCESAAPESPTPHRQLLIRYCSEGMVVGMLVAFHSGPGSKLVMDCAIFWVSDPRSRWYRTPSWFVMKVMMPELRYCAGYATKAK